MDGYTKINGTNKSRSKNFSDLQTFPQPHKTNENLSPNHTIFHDVIDLESISKSQKQIKNQETHDENENGNDKENEDAIANEEKMKGGNNNNNTPSAVKLNRACSVSANRFRLERQGSKSTTTTSSFQSVKRAFSMRRSSSVSEKYCRIHDQGFTISSPILDDVAEAYEGMEKKKKNGSGRILKACKRLFGI